MDREQLVGCEKRLKETAGIALPGPYQPCGSGTAAGDSLAGWMADLQALSMMSCCPQGRQARQVKVPRQVPLPSDLSQPPSTQPKVHAIPSIDPKLIPLLAPSGTSYNVEHHKKAYSSRIRAAHLKQVTRLPLDSWSTCSELDIKDTTPVLETNRLLISTSLHQLGADAFICMCPCSPWAGPSTPEGRYLFRTHAHAPAQHARPAISDLFYSSAPSSC